MQHWVVELKRVLIVAAALLAVEAMLAQVPILSDREPDRRIVAFVVAIWVMLGLRPAEASRLRSASWGVSGLAQLSLALLAGLLGHAFLVEIANSGGHPNLEVWLATLPAIAILVAWDARRRGWARAPAVLSSGRRTETPSGLT